MAAKVVHDRRDSLEAIISIVKKSSDKQWYISARPVFTADVCMIALTLSFRDENNILDYMQIFPDFNRDSDSDILQ